MQFLSELEQLSDGDWDKLDATMGLKVAVKAELARRPAKALSAAEDVELVEEMEMPERLRRFLLLPGPDGKEPQPLRQVSSFFLAVLTAPPSNRQHMVLTLCEMLALVSGLFLAIPIMLRRPWEADASEKGWELPPTIYDGMDTLVAIAFTVLSHVAFFSVQVGLHVAASGWRGSVQFYEAAMSSVGVLLFAFVFGAWLPLQILLFWQLLTSAACPYPLLVALVFDRLTNSTLVNLTCKFQLISMPLEIYHLPRWCFVFTPALWGYLKDDKDLKAAAVRRAAELRRVSRMKL